MSQQSTPVCFRPLALSELILLIFNGLLNNWGRKAGGGSYGVHILSY